MRSAPHRALAFRGAWRVLAALALVAFALPAAAIQDICVQSQADLASALDAVQYVAQNIKIRQGTYSLDGTVWTADTYSVVQADTTIGGGYTANCASRNIAAGNTILTATQDAWVEGRGNLTVEGLTFELAYGIGFEMGDIYEGFVPGSQLTIRRDEFRQSGGTVEVYSDFDTATAKFVDSLFVDNSVGTANCVLSLESYYGAPQFQLVNNTVYGNTGKGVCMQANAGYSSPALSAHNNIFFNNTGTDLYTEVANVELVRNTYGTFQGPAPNSESGTQHGDPTLNASYHLIQSPPSPAINSGEYAGSAGLPAHDLDGGPRVVGTRVDRGAYESTLDDNFVLTVTNTNDSGAGSLRAAINSANANGTALIGFNIPGSCAQAHVIALATPLPAITASVFIGGYSQPGSSQNALDYGVDATLCVVLDGSAINRNTYPNANGLLVDATAPATARLVVTGLGLGGFEYAAINLSGGSGHGVTGSHIGGNVSGVALDPCGWGVFVGSGGGSATIGGDDAADRNIIGDAVNDGIRLFTAGNTVANNYIGVGWNNATSNTVDRGNGRNGITATGADNQIHDNWVDYSAVGGIVVNNASATGNVVEHNTIQVNGGAGVSVDFGAHDNKFRYNMIFNNLGAGVRVANGLGNVFRFNGIDHNGALGIDIAGAGMSANDDDSAAGAPNLGNRGLNFPVLSQASASYYVGGSVQGTLASTPGDYYIDLYLLSACDASGYGEGWVWLASQKITIGSAQQSVSFTIPLAPSWLQPPGVITATATDAPGNSSPGNTSEFSTCKPLIEERLFANGFD